MSVELFRKEVIAAKKTDRLGGIRIVPPRMGWFFFCGAIVVLVTLIGLSVFGRYSRTEKISGRLVPSAGQSNVVALAASGATVADVLVSEGDRVSLGQPLVKISSQRSSAAFGDTGELISTQLASKLKQLRTSLAAQGRLSELKTRDLHNRIGLLRSRIARLDLQIQDQDRRYEAANTLHETWKTNGKGVVSGYQLAQQYDAVLQQKSLAQDVRNQRLQAMIDLGQAEAELTQLPAVMSEQTASLNVQIADVESEKAENEQQRGQIIRAPAAGVVAGILAHPGQAVDGSSQLMVILPENSKLVAELWAPSSAVDLLQVGEPVEISYEAFPAARYGKQNGKILSISTNAVSAAEIGRILGNSQTSSGYRVIVEIVDANPFSFLSRFAQKPGMTLSAKFDVETRSLIDWMLRPSDAQSAAGKEKEAAGNG